MFKRKQVLAVVGIAIISFVIGSMFNVMATDSGNPWDKVWTAITGLQDRVSTIEQSSNQVRTIRFVEPNETMNNQRVSKDAAVFIWSPNNSTNNAILSIRCYFQYRTQMPPTGNLMWRLEVDGEILPYMESLQIQDYTWSRITTIQHIYGTNVLQNLKIRPNQENYTIKFQIRSTGNEVYVKNINMILTVIDGLPASNP